MASDPDRLLAELEAARAEIAELKAALLARPARRALEPNSKFGTSEVELRLAVEATGIGLWSYEPKTGQVSWSQRMCEIHGRWEPPPIERYTELVVHDEDRARVEESISLAMAGKDVHWVRYRIVHPDGTVRWALPAGRVLRDSSGAVEAIVGGILDVTEVQDLQDRLRHAEKMESLGRLTAGVAHNLNNLLGVIRTALDLLPEQLKPEGHALLDDASKATGRASKVVGQLMTFANKRHATKPPVVALQQLARETVELSRRSLPKEIDLAYQETGGEAAIEANPSDLAEVLTNLILNARDALIDANAVAPRIEIVVETTGQPRHGFARLRVSDNGPGMNEETRRRVFDPFFTTKGSTGLGLGLALSWTAVERCGGSMECQSTLGRGTIFSIDLPISSSRPVATGSDRPAAPEAHAGLRILLVEDDAPLLRVTKRALVRGGHLVIEATAGASALDVLKTTTVDLVLLDQSLPDCAGTDIVPDLRELAPSAKLALFTGQDFDDANLSGVDALLPKPMGARTLLAEVARIASATG